MGQTGPASPGTAAAQSHAVAHQAESGIARALAEASAKGNTSRESDAARIYKGTGVLINGQQPGQGVAAPLARASGGPVGLNFEGADVREVVRNILGDLLNQA